MPSILRLETIAYALVAILVVSWSAAFAAKPADVSPLHGCAGTEVQTSAHNDHKQPSASSACCLGMQCCPLLPASIHPGLAFRLDPIRPPRVVVDSPLLLIRDIDPPPRGEDL